MISINVADLMTMNEMMVGMLISPVTPNHILHNKEPGRIDGMAVELECDEERAVAIVDVLRMNCKRLRAYKGSRKIRVVS